jgi:hypothetical protein
VGAKKNTKTTKNNSKNAKETKNLTDQANQKSETKTNDTETKKPKSKFWFACLIFLAIFLGITLVGVIVAMVFGFTLYNLGSQAVEENQDKVNQIIDDVSEGTAQFKEQTAANQINETQQANQTVKNSADKKQLEYNNNKFGFKLILPQGWEDYKVEEQLMGGDFQIADVNFYLPTRDLNYTSGSKFPGYFQVFTVSVFINEEYNRTALNDPMQYGDSAGENRDYLLTFSHMNGTLPSDVPSSTLQALDQIYNSIQVFTPTEQVGAIDDSQVFNSNSGSVNNNNSPQSNNSQFSEVDVEMYQNNSIHYWNCNYFYSLYYPTNWTNNGMDKYSKRAQMQGDGITASVEAFPRENSLKNFADKRLRSIGGTIINSKDVYNDNVRVLGYELQNPGSTAIFWDNGSNMMEFRIYGSGFKNNQYNVYMLVASFDFNHNDPDCSKTYNTNPAPASNQNYNYYNEDYDTDYPEDDWGGDVPDCDYDNDPDCW